MTKQPITNAIQAVNNPAICKHNKQVAIDLIDRFKWTDDQLSYLHIQARKGYVVTNLNDACQIFGQKPVTNGDRVTVTAIHKGLANDLKRDTFVAAI